MWADVQRNGRPAEYRWCPVRNFRNVIPCATPQSLADARFCCTVQSRCQYRRTQDLKNAKWILHVARGATGGLRGTGNQSGRLCPRPQSGNLGSFRRGWPGDRRQIHFASSFAITCRNNVLTINALRDAGLQRQGKHAYCCTLFIVCPSLFSGISVCSLMSQRHLVSCCIADRVVKLPVIYVGGKLPVTYR